METWKSKIQMEISFFTAEEKCVTFSTSLRETMLIMELLREAGIAIGVPKCDNTMKCTVFEDNNGPIELAKAPNMRLRTKYVSIKHHYFHYFVERGFVLIEKVGTAGKKWFF